jgi:hypothetical protein
MGAMVTIGFCVGAVLYLATLLALAHAQDRARAAEQRAEDAEGRLVVAESERDAARQSLREAHRSLREACAVCRAVTYARSTTVSLSN